ncbi:TnpV protein [Lawsonibacter sp. OA9]
MKRIAKRKGITDQPKAEHRMEWVKWMSSIRDRVTEIINGKFYQ